MNKKLSSKFPVRKGMTSGNLVAISAIASAVAASAFMMYRNVIHPNVCQSVKSVTSGTLSAPLDSNSTGNSGFSSSIGPGMSTERGNDNRRHASPPSKAPKPPRQSLFALGPSTGAQGYAPSDYQRRKATLAKYNNDNKIRQPGTTRIEDAVQNAAASVVIVGIVDRPPADSSWEPTYPVPSYGVLALTPKENCYVVLSAYHVVKGCGSLNNVYVRFADGSVVTPIATARDTEKDIVVLSIAAKDVPKDAVPAKLRDNADMKSPDVAAFAPPTGDGLEDPTLYRRSNSFMTGKLAKKGGTGDFMFKAPIKGGCSGGPIVDKDGAVIGLIQSRHKDDERDARGIPIYDAILLADKNLERLTSPAVVKNEQVVLKNASYSSR